MPPFTPPLPPAAPPPCSAEIDLVMVLDNSGSVGAQRSDLISFARAVVGNFAMGDTAAQIAYVEFETTVATHSALTPSLANITAALDSAPGIGRQTFLSGGIDLGQSVVTGAGARAGVPKVMVLMSDGVQTVGGDDNTAIAAAANAKAAGTKIIAVGFGDASLVTLSSIASDASDAMLQPTANDLVSALSDGTLAICTLAADLPRGPPPSPPTFAALTMASPCMENTGFLVCSRGKTRVYGRERQQAESENSG